MGSALLASLFPEPYDSYVMGRAFREWETPSLDIAAPESDMRTLTIERTFNSGSGGIDLALTIGKHS